MENFVDNPVVEKEPTLTTYVWDLVKVIALSVALVFGIIRPFIAEPYIVSGLSMFPNFHDKEYLIIEKLSYRFGEIQRGDVVVLRYPKNPKDSYIKRVIALPGEKIKFENGRVFVYNLEKPEGFELDEPYLGEHVFTDGSQVITSIGEGEYFVLGDNRPHSSDSRAWGVLPEKDVVGKVLLRVLPINRFGILN